MTTLKYRIKENFRWMAAPEFQIVDTGKNTVTIKGVAVKKGQVSRNKRKYVGEELAKGARTFIGRPITINHAPYEKSHPMYDGRKVVGNVDWMEYEDGAMEYRAKINKQPYVDLIRNNSVEIRGVSIEADYLFNRCSQCGKDFYNKEEFDSHMIGEHFIRNYHYEPRGIVGKALSLVLSPEEPGVPDTTLELVETAGAGGFSELLETVIHEKKEKETHMAKTTEKKKIPYKTRVLKEQEEETPPSPPCPEGWHEEDGKCVKNPEATEQEETPTPPCPEGYHEVDGQCVKDEATEEPVTEQETPAPVTDETPVEEPEPLPPPPLECGDGFHLEDGACVPDEEVTAQEPEPEMPAEATETTVPTIKTTLEMKLPTLLRLREPCSPELKSCVDQLIDKGTPEDSAWAICRSKVGETTQPLPANLYEAQKHLGIQISDFNTACYARDNKIQQTVNQLNSSIAKLATYTTSLPKPINNGFKESFKTQREEAKKIFAELGKLRSDIKAVKEYNAKKFGQLATTQSKSHNVAIAETRKLAVASKKLAESFNVQFHKLSIADNKLAENFTTQFQKLSVADANLKENIDAKTRDFEKILALADKNAAELTEHNKTLEDRVKEMEEKQKASTTEKRVEETTKLIERLDNLEQKLKGQFKGANKPLEQSDSGGKNDELGAKKPYEK